MTCATCFYHEAANDNKGGFCRRYPGKPLAMKLNSPYSEVYTVWPWVGENDWCGEYKLKTEPETVKLNGASDLPSASTVLR